MYIEISLYICNERKQIKTKVLFFCNTLLIRMITTSLIFRKINFIILDKLLNNGDYSIEAKAFINPLDKKFEKPIRNELTKKNKNK